MKPSILRCVLLLCYLLIVKLEVISNIELFWTQYSPLFMTAVTSHDKPHSQRESNDISVLFAVVATSASAAGESYTKEYNTSFQVSSHLFCARPAM